MTSKVCYYIVLPILNSYLFCIVTLSLSQTSFGHISINSSMILMVSKAMESPQKDLSIDASHILKQSILAEILSRLTGNHHITIY